MSQPLHVMPLRTSVFQLGQDLHTFIVDNLGEQTLVEGSVLAITSKIVSLSESRVVKKNSIDRDKLILQEADHDLGKVAFDCRLTIKHGLFIPSAGIDESNSESGDFILFPEAPYESARRIHRSLGDFYGLKKFGVLITDSNILPLRQGVTGIALAYWGFEGVKNLVGQKDIFGRVLKMTKMDLADGLACSAVLMMGEADESCPLALIENAPVRFTDIVCPKEIQIPAEEDLYYPLYKDRLNKKDI